jgi:putative transcriptional regulator
LIRENNYKEGDLRLFIGYSGWAAGQLDKEMEEGAWMVGGVTEQLIFETEASAIWKQAVGLLGKDYAFVANMPIDPQLN